MKANRPSPWLFCVVNKTENYLASNHRTIKGAIKSLRKRQSAHPKDTFKIETYDPKLK